TGVEDIDRALHIGQVIVPITTTDAGARRDVKDHVAAAYRGGDALGISQVAACLLDSQPSQVRVVASRKAAYPVAACKKLPDDGAAEKTAAAGYQAGGHSFQILSCSPKVLSISAQSSAAFL